MTRAEDDRAALAGEAWALMSDLVLDHQRRREVVEATGISFGRSRALRRLARRPMSMREFAEAMGIDPPNATTVIDDLERLGLARRRPHPTDRRAKIVEPTDAGLALARTADAILHTPPAALGALSPEDLATLRDLLERARGAP
jgi:DNA-binding MarR family transcriptional regulator